ncbi:MAG: hypothetical protein SNJ63_01715 [Sphingomonadaceae bacterium]
MTRLMPLVIALAAAGCAPSVLHFGGDSRIAAPGEIPRDSRGEPVWSAIRPTPPGWKPADAREAAPVQEGSQP